MSRDAEQVNRRLLRAVPNRSNPIRIGRIPSYE